MKTRPILMNGEMVRAVLAGRKTQTRRICKGQRELSCAADFPLDKCPVGVVGDRLYVRETWARSRNNWLYAASCGGLKPQECVGEWDWSRSLSNTWRPSIHMPKRASRIRLEITGVRAERLHEITETDAIAEGVKGGGCFNCGRGEPCGCNQPWPMYRESFIHLWTSIYGPDSWGDNPWVWAVEFKRIEGVAR